MKDTIIFVTIEILREVGLEGLTIDAVALRARCAKGLIHCHFRTRADLLRLAGLRLDQQRMEARREALAPGGSESVDRLWEVLRAEVATGSYAAWQDLLAAREIQLEDHVVPPIQVAGELRQLAGVALALPVSRDETGFLLTATLEGLQQLLLRGASESAVRDAYHRFWLAALE